MDPEFEKLKWASIDDRVMGGVSSSSAEVIESGTIVFQGTVSTRYGGGFASVRAMTPGLDLAGRNGLRLRVKGDGKRYKISFKNTPDFDGPVFQASFDADPPEEWIEIRLPFSEFAPTFRGMSLPDSVAFDPGRIESIGLMISEKQAGTFRLEIESIEVY